MCPECVPHRAVCADRDATAMKRKIYLIAFLLLFFHLVGLGRQPELVVQTGHTGVVTQLAFSPTGTLLASADSSGTIKLWDLTTSKLLRTISEDSDPIRSLSFNFDGTMLAGTTAALSSKIKVWDVGSGAQTVKLGLDNEKVTAIAFNPHRNILASSTDDGAVRFWDITTGKEVLARKKYTRSVRALVYGRQEKLLAVSEAGKRADQVTLWDVGLSKELGTFGRPGQEMTAVAVNAAGDFLAIGETTGVVTLWKVGGLQKARILDSHHGTVSSLVFSSDGRKLMTGGKDQVIRVWDVQTGALLRTLAVSALKDAAIQRIPQYLSGDKSGKNKWDADQLLSMASEYTEKLSLKLGDGIRMDLGSSAEFQSLRGKSNIVGALAHALDGNLIAGGVGDEIRVWSLTSGTEIGTLSRRSDIVTSISFHMVEPLLASGQINGDVALWDIEQGSRVRTLNGHRTPIRALCFSSKKSLLASGSDAGMIKLWDYDSGREIATFVGHEDRVTSLAFTADEKMLVSGSSDGTVRVWDLPAGATRWIFRFSAPQSADAMPASPRPLGDKEPPGLRRDLPFIADSFAVHPREQILALKGLGRQIFLYDLVSGQQLPSLEKEQTSDMAFSPDGDLLASSTEALIHLWDWRKGEIKQTLQGAKGKLVRIAFSRSGKFVIGATLSGTVEVWDALTAKNVVALTARLEGSNAISLSANDLAATATTDGKIVLWKLASGEQIATLVSTESEGYVIATSGNHYLATKGALSSIAFRLGNRAYPFDQFDIKLNRPDIVLQNLGAKHPRLIEGYRRMFHWRLSKMKWIEEQLTDEPHLPEVNIIRANPRATSTAAKRISFKVKAVDSLHALDRLNVNVNDVPLFGSGGISLRSRNLKQHEQDITVELASGRNRVQVSATNVVGVESLRQSFEIHCEAPAKPALYVIAIGVSTYADASYNLKFAAKDAADISAAFAGPQKGFDRVYVRRILDRKATRANILNVRTILTQAGVDDTVILFLAGHGILDENLDYYFATTDIDFNNPRRNGLSYDDLEGILDGLKARRKVLLLDTCHSGELNRESLLTPSPAGGRGIVVRAITQRRDAFRDVGLTDSFDLLQEYFAELRRGSGALVIVASSGASYALESDERRNGLFTFSVLEGISGQADQDLDGQITVSELRDYVGETVKRYTGGRQMPTTRRDSIEFDFPVAKRSILSP